MEVDLLRGERCHLKGKATQYERQPEAPARPDEPSGSRRSRRRKAGDAVFASGEERRDDFDLLHRVFSETPHRKRKTKSRHSQSASVPYGSEPVVEHFPKATSAQAARYSISEIGNPIEPLLPKAGTGIDRRYRRFVSPEMERGARPGEALKNEYVGLDKVLPVRKSLSSAMSAVRPSKQSSDTRRDRLFQSNNDEEEDAMGDQCTLYQVPESVVDHDDNCETVERISPLSQAFDEKGSRASMIRYLIGSGLLPSWENMGGTESSSDRADSSSSSTTPQYEDRPPSRQRHAFPTHLIDEGDLEDRECRNQDYRGPSNGFDNAPAPPPFHQDRPPSRYMSKSKRNRSKQQSPNQNESGLVGRLPSRRCVRQAYGSWNQTAPISHDPKTDGFAEVDESVPPPFRIEITNDALNSKRQNMSSASSNASTISASSNSSSNQDYEEQRKRLRSRRWSSFGNKEQLRRLAEHEAEISIKTSAPHWFKDDQIDNAHLFETVCSPDAEIDDFIDITPTAKGSFSQREPYPPPASRPMLSGHNLTQKNFDLMDPENAIAQTPLFPSGDLMSIENEINDLRLDDIVVPDSNSSSARTNSYRSSSSGPSAGSGSSPTSVRHIETSLGRDFLSLFAQS